MIGVGQYCPAPSSPHVDAAMKPDCRSAYACSRLHVRSRGRASPWFSSFPESSFLYTDMRLLWKRALAVTSRELRNTSLSLRKSPCSPPPSFVLISQRPSFPWREACSCSLPFERGSPEQQEVRCGLASRDFICNIIFILWQVFALKTQMMNLKCGLN